MESSLVRDGDLRLRDVADKPYDYSGIKLKPENPHLVLKQCGEQLERLKKFIDASWTRWRVIVGSTEAEIRQIKKGVVGLHSIETINLVLEKVEQGLQFGNSSDPESPHATDYNISKEIDFQKRYLLKIREIAAQQNQHMSLFHEILRQQRTQALLLMQQAEQIEEEFRLDVQESLARTNMVQDEIVTPVAPIPRKVEQPGFMKQTQMALSPPKLRRFFRPKTASPPPEDIEPPSSTKPLSPPKLFQRFRSKTHSPRPSLSEPSVSSILDDLSQPLPVKKRGKYHRIDDRTRNNIVDMLKGVLMGHEDEVHEEHIDVDNVPEGKDEMEEESANYRHQASISLDEVYDHQATHLDEDMDVDSVGNFDEDDDEEMDDLEDDFKAKTKKRVEMFAKLMAKKAKGLRNLKSPPPET